MLTTRLTWVPCSDVGVTEVQVDQPEQRGRLAIADKAVDRIATIAVTAVDGVVASDSTLDKVIGRQFPKTFSEVRGDQVRVTVEVAVEWPRVLTDVVHQIRTVVTTQVGILAGLHVRRVDVIVAKMERPAPPHSTTGRVR